MLERAQEPERAQELRPGEEPSCRRRRTGAGPFGARCASLFGAMCGAWIDGVEASGTSFLAQDTLDHVVGHEDGHGIGRVGLLDETGLY